jgi:hypothetical protein
MSSTASGLNALASTTAIDIYKRNLKEENQKSIISMRQSSFTLFWGIVAILLQVLVPYSKNLIQVNIVVPFSTERYLNFFWLFYIKFVKPKPLQCSSEPNHHFHYILLCFFFSWGSKLGYLWLNFIGAMLTIFCLPHAGHLQK